MSINHERNYLYKLRCMNSSCGAFVKSHKYTCIKCNNDQSFICVDHPEKEDQYSAVCDKCACLTSSSVFIEHCKLCNKDSVGWFSDQVNAWWQYSMPQGLETSEKIWIKGSFTGEAFSPLRRNIWKSNLYKLEFISGVIKNPVLASGPPELTDNVHQLPWMQRQVANVDVVYGPNKDQHAKVTLYDFHLYQYDKVGLSETTSDVMTGSRSAVGVFEGVCYATINPEISSPKIHTLDERYLYPPDLTIADTINQNDHLENANKYNPENHTFSNDLNIDEQKNNLIISESTNGISCAICNKIFIMSVLFIGFLIIHMSVFSGLVLLTMWWCFCNFKHRNRNASFIWHNDEADIFCNNWVILFLSAFFYLISGNLAVSFIGVFLICWLICKISPYFRGFLGFNPAFEYLLGLFLVFIALLGVWFILGGLKWLPCQNEYKWGIVLPLIALCLTVLSSSNIIRAAVIILWLFALCVFSLQHYGNCTGSFLANGSVGNLFSGINNPASQINDWVSDQINNLSNSSSENMSNSDEINVANQVAAASGQPPKISLEQVVNNPQILDDCQNKIYFPNATSFAHDSDQITPEFERQLEQLAKLRDQFPNRLLIVTGHSDRMGDETEAGVVHNLDLSRRRANSVAQWFATHSQWTLEQMQVEGIGSDAPLLDLPGDVPVNRRVEINLNCR
jgi:outer membrane protein OmpA-like peptidoglycan-associated protein